MSTITWPASLVPKTASLRLQTVQRVHASPFGGSEQTVDLLNDRWMLSLTLTQRAGFDWGAKAEAFIAALRGQTNTVALWHFARPTVRGTLASATCATVAKASVLMMAVTLAAVPMATMASMVLGFQLNMSTT